MLLYSATSLIPLPTTFLYSHPKKKNNNNKLLLNNPFSIRRTNTSSCIHLGAGVHEIAEIAHNKVLIAASISAAIGQLSKPFTSSILYGNDVDFKASVQAGGFPSTHSAAVVAAATSLGLERGFSDSIFGMSLVYASLVMYDAQGVRREVGNHAKALNRLLLKTQEKSVPYKDEDDLIDSKPGTSSSMNSESSLAPIVSLSEKATSYTTDTANFPTLRSGNNTMIQSSLRGDGGEKGSEKARDSLIPLKESIGHTEWEVVAGALLGFLVGLAVYTVM